MSAESPHHTGVGKSKRCAECKLLLVPSICANCGAEDSKETFAKNGGCYMCGQPLCGTCGLPIPEFGASYRG